MKALGLYLAGVLCVSIGCRRIAIRQCGMLKSMHLPKYKIFDLTLESVDIISLAGCVEDG